MKAAKRSLPGLSICLILVTAGVVLAGSGAGYDLSWNTVDGGGVTFNTGGNYRLGGTAGQPDAGVLSAGSIPGGDYTLVGGFWGAAAVEYKLYLPLVLRNF